MKDLEKVTELIHDALQLLEAAEAFNAIHDYNHGQLDLIIQMTTILYEDL